MREYCKQSNAKNSKMLTVMVKGSITSWGVKRKRMSSENSSKNRRDKKIKEKQIQDKINKI